MARDPTSVAIGWLNIVADYGAKGDGETNCTSQIQTALQDAQAGNPSLGIPPGSTVYIPPGSYVIDPASLSAITAPCAIVGAVGVAAVPNQPPKGPPYAGGPTLSPPVSDYSRNILTIEADGVSLSDFQISYPTGLPTSSSSVAAIQFTSCNRIGARRLHIGQAFAGIGCTGCGDILFERVVVDGLSAISNDAPPAFGFMAMTAPAKPTGTGMRCIRCKLRTPGQAGDSDLGVPGTYGFILGAGYPELLVRGGGVEKGQYGCQSVAETGTSSEALRVVGTHMEKCDRAIEADGGALLQVSAVASNTSHLVVVASDTFAGIASLTGSIFGSIQDGGLFMGNATSGGSSASLVSAVGLSIDGNGANSGSGVLVSSTSVSLVTLSSLAIRNIIPAEVLAAAITIQLASAGSVAIKGISQTNPASGTRDIGLAFASPPSPTGPTPVTSSIFDADDQAVGFPPQGTPFAPQIYNTVGVNPLSNFSSPNFPASGASVANLSGVDVTVYIADSNGTAVTGVKINGASVGLSDSGTGAPGKTSTFTVLVPAGGTIEIDYQAVPPHTITWTWLGG